MPRLKQASLWNSSDTCTASSRVGQRMSACTTLRAGLVFAMVGMAKAAVVPEPVWDCPTTSRPASGRVAAALLPGVGFTGIGSLALAAVLLGLVNAFMRPVVFLLTLPLTLVTLGLFLLVVNAAMIGLTAWLLPGFTVDGFVSGVLAAIVTGVVSWIGHAVVRER